VEEFKFSSDNAKSEATCRQILTSYLSNADTSIIPALSSSTAGAASALVTGYTTGGHSPEMFSEFEEDVVSNSFIDVWIQFKRSPEYNSTIKPIRLDKSNSLNLRLLDHVRNPTGFKMFREFLCKKLCEENIDFLVAADAYIAEQDPTEKANKATKLYDTFIGPRASAPLNLPPKWEVELKQKWDIEMIEPLQLEIAQLLLCTMWPSYTKEHEGYSKYLYNQIFGLPEESVPEKLFLLFLPNAEGGMEKKTLPNSPSTTVRQVLTLQCEYRGLNLDNLSVTDKGGSKISNLDVPLASIPDRIIILRTN